MNGGNNVLLDGEYVDPSTINPARHRFLGAFRPPVDIFANCKADIICPCGEVLRFVGQSRKHWAQGCQDIPQYATITKEAVT